MTKHVSGERRLFLAILEDAVRLVRKDAHCERHLLTSRQIEADLRWLHSEDRSWPCSFVNVCTHLGLEPEWVRRMIFAELPNPADASLHRSARATTPSLANRAPAAEVRQSSDGHLRR
jgi:hypothetical protein